MATGRTLVVWGRGTTVQRRGGECEISRNARTTGTGFRFTSTTAASPSTLISRYHAPRRRLQFKSACSRAHTIMHSRLRPGGGEQWCNGVAPSMLNDRYWSDGGHVTLRRGNLPPS